MINYYVSYTRNSNVFIINLAFLDCNFDLANLKCPLKDGEVCIKFVNFGLILWTL